MANILRPNDVFLFSWCGPGTQVPDVDGDERQWDPNDKYDEVICPYDTNKINNRPFA